MSCNGRPRTVPGPGDVTCWSFPWASSFSGYLKGCRTWSHRQGAGWPGPGRSIGHPGIASALVRGGIRRLGGVRTLLLIVSALAIGAVIAWVGIVALRAASGPGPRERSEPEDVEDLDVYLVCTECGTEFRVTRLGELQVPRHCGEPMEVVRRPRETR